MKIIYKKKKERKERKGKEKQKTSSIDYKPSFSSFHRSIKEPLAVQIRKKVIDRKEKQKQRKGNFLFIFFSFGTFN